MSNNQKSETCPNRRVFFLSFKFMFSKQALPLFIGRPNNFQFNRKVSRENCKRCIWNEVRENILKQSWFIWIMGPHKLSFQKKKKKKYKSCAADNSYSNNVPKTCTMRQKSPWAIHLRLSLTHTCKNVARAATTCENIVNSTPALSTSLSWLCVKIPGRGSDHVTSYKGSPQEPSEADVLLFKAEVHACLLYNI